MTAIQKRILAIMSVLVIISTTAAIGSSLWLNHSLEKQGVSIEAILADKR